MDHSRITCRALDEASGYTEGGRCKRLLSHFLCQKALGMCGHICGQLAVLLFSSDWLTTISLSYRPERFPSPTYPPARAFRWTASSIFHLCETWLGGVALGSVEEILRWIKQDRKMSPCAAAYKLFHRHSLCFATGAALQTCVAPRGYCEPRFTLALYFPR